jgi:hypothetical protein
MNFPTDMDDQNSSRVKLYNITEDPREMTNVAALYPDIVELIESKILAYVDQHKDHVQDLSIDLNPQVILVSTI